MGLLQPGRLSGEIVPWRNHPRENSSPNCLGTISPEKSSHRNEFSGKKILEKSPPTLNCVDLYVTIRVVTILIVNQQLMVMKDVLSPFHYPPFNCQSASDGNERCFVSQLLIVMGNARCFVTILIVSQQLMVMKDVLSPFNCQSATDGNERCFVNILIVSQLLMVMGNARCFVTILIVNQ